MGVAVYVRWLGGVGGVRVGGASGDGEVKVAGEGGGEALEAAALEAGDGAGGQAGGCGGGDSSVPDDAPYSEEIGAEATVRIGGEGGEVEVAFVAELLVLVRLVLLGGAQRVADLCGCVAEAGEGVVAPDGDVDGGAAAR